MRSLDGLLVCVGAVLLAAQPAAVAAESPRERLSLDANWKFHRGDIPRESFPGGQGVALYGADITHSDGNSITKEHATAIYRARVTLTEEDLKVAEVRLRFAGCDDDGWFFVNNQFVGESHDWSSQPVFNAKQFLRAGDNVIAVGVKNSWGGGGLKPEVNLDFVDEPKPLSWARSLFNGLAQVIVQSAGAAGEIKLTATAAGLASATVMIKAQPGAPRPFVP